jgi:phage terminase small subunit
LLRNVKVKNYIKKLQAELEEKTKITAEKVIKEFAKIAFHNPKNLFDETGNIIPVNELPDDVAAALTEIRTEHFKPNPDDAGFLVKTTYKTASKTAALENLGKHLGIFERDNKQKADSPAALFLELMKQATSK